MNRCNQCGGEIHEDNPHDENYGCMECHDSCATYDECGCERCFERVVERADAYLDSLKDG